jgi:hypothetical protein
MYAIDSAKYTPISQDEESNSGPTSHSGAITRRASSCWIYILTALLAFFSGFIAHNLIMKRLVQSLSDSVAPHELSWHPDLHPDTAWIKFEGGLYTPSDYRGTPQKSIDEAWARYTKNPWFDGGAVILGVTEDHIRNSRKASDEEWFNSTVRLDEMNGGQYMGTLEIFHQLHCLVCTAKFQITSTAF